MFECDCNVKWLADWILEYSLQITSRERNPQFCAKPSHLRNKQFTQIDLDDLVCLGIPTTFPKPPPSLPTTSPRPSYANYDVSIVDEDNSSNTMSTIRSTTTTTTTTTEAPTTLDPPTTVRRPAKTVPRKQVTKKPKQRTRPTKDYQVSVSPKIGVNTRSSSIESHNSSIEVTDQKPSQTNITQPTGPPTEVLDTVNPTNLTGHLKNSNSNFLPAIEPNRTAIQDSISLPSLRLIDVSYSNNSIHLRWEPLSPSLSGYQVVYRYFGTTEYHRSDRIAVQATNHTLTDFISPNELLVVCVVNLDNPTANKDESAIPISQCGELSTRETPTSQGEDIVTTNNVDHYASGKTVLSSWYPSLNRMNDIDKVVIGVSALVCVFIVVAVIAFSCCFYRPNSIQKLNTNTAGFPSKPVLKPSIDWDTVSVYSTRSIPRAKMSSEAILSAVIDRNQQALGVRPLYYGGYNGKYAPQVATMPSKGREQQWMSNYLQCYPSPNHHLPPISYGTTVTATGGQSAPDIYGRNTYSLGRPYSRKERPSYGPHSNRNKTRGRARTRNKPQIPELRINRASSGHRLLLSSSSNSNSCSQNEYDSDMNVTPPSVTHFGGISKMESFANRMEENEVDVDIYVDQNYMKRFT